MVKIIYLPKWEQQAARRIARDPVATALLPMKSVVRIAICQDGRIEACRSNLEFEASYFEKLYWEYLYRTDIAIQCYEFSFGGDLPQLLNELATTDIFLMTGFSPGQRMSETLLTAFRTHDGGANAVVGTVANGIDTKFDPLGIPLIDQVFRAVRDRVQYNDMAYMGVCGGAICAGHMYLEPWRLGAWRQLELFDFCMGVSLRYDSGMPPESCDPAVICARVFQMTSGAGLAVHIERDIARASSFPCGKNNSWVSWCRESTDRHQQIVEIIAREHASGPWYHPDVGYWRFRLNGTCSPWMG